MELQSLRFDWNDGKACENMRKHGVSFNDAAKVFVHPLTRYRRAMASIGEERMLATGFFRWELLHVVYVERGEVIRITSARRCTSKEIRGYEQSKYTGG